MSPLARSASGVHEVDVRRLSTDVLVVGAGHRRGVVRDVALRGSSTILVERVDVGQGTTGRFHGLLHAGGRYIVSDPRSATECAKVVEVLQRIAADAIETTGGMFVTSPLDDSAYADEFLAACQTTGVTVEEIPIAKALRREPCLTSKISRAFARQRLRRRRVEADLGQRPFGRGARRHDPALPLGHRGRAVARRRRRRGLRRAR